MHRSALRKALDNSMSEDDVADTIKEAITRSPHTWLSYHTHNSQHSAEGFPDWALIHNHNNLTYLCFWELKKQTGKTTPNQRLWLAALDQLPKQNEHTTTSVAIIRPCNLTEATTFLLTLEHPPQLQTGDLP